MPLERAKRWHPLNRGIWVAARVTLAGHLLQAKGDRVSMHSSVEVRYPFLDLRIVDFLLALPPFPWFFEKKLLREAMIGRLPESARVRPKTPLAGDPLAQKLRGPETAWLDQVQWNADMGRYVNQSAISPLRTEKGLEQARSDVRPLCLNFWLQSARRVRYNLHAEVCNA